MFKESKEFPGSVEGTVKFERETSCALDSAFEHNPEAAEQLAEIVGEEKLSLFRDILSNTLDPENRPEMKFVPSEEMKTVYGQIAKKELDKIETEGGKNENLPCGHTVDEHREALERVVEKLQTTVN